MNKNYTLATIFFSFLIFAFYALNSFSSEKSSTSQTIEMDYAKEPCNTKYKNDIPAHLVKSLKYRLEKTILESKGESPVEIEEIIGRPPARSGMPTTGTINIFVFLVALPDYPLVNNRAVIHQKLFADGDPEQYPYDSLRNYYLLSSYNKLDLQGTVFDWQTKSYYRDDLPPTISTKEMIIKE